MDSALLRIDPRLFTGLSPDTVYTSTVSGGYMSIYAKTFIDPLEAQPEHVEGESVRTEGKIHLL